MPARKGDPYCLARATWHRPGHRQTECRVPVFHHHKVSAADLSSPELKSVRPSPDLHCQTDAAHKCSSCGTPLRERHRCGHNPEHIDPRRLLSSHKGCENPAAEL